LDSSQSDFYSFEKRTCIVKGKADAVRSVMKILS
jgi:hypothetical protein